jgi:hypothetical protein
MKKGDVSPSLIEDTTVEPTYHQMTTLVCVGIGLGADKPAKSEVKNE